MLQPGFPVPQRSLSPGRVSCTWIPCQACLFPKCPPPWCVGWLTLSPDTRPYPSMCSSECRRSLGHIARIASSLLISEETTLLQDRHRLCCLNAFGPPCCLPQRRSWTLAEAATALPPDPGLRAQSCPMDPMVPSDLVGAQHNLLCQVFSTLGTDRAAGAPRDSQKSSHVAHQSRVPHSSLVIAPSGKSGSACPSG